MTRFKKCDYCGNTAKSFHKLKSQPPLFDPHKKEKDMSGGGYAQQVPLMIRLCDTCNDWFLRDKPTEGFDISEIPELEAIFDKKKRRVM